MKWITRSAIALGALIAVATAFLGWLLTAEAGARWMAGIVQDVVGGAFEIGSVDGTIAGPLILKDVRYRDSAAGIYVVAERIAVDLALADLLRGLVHVKDADLNGVDIVLHESSQPVPTGEEPQHRFSLQPPVDLVVDSLVVNGAQIRRDSAVLLDLARAALAGHWTDEGLAVERLDVRSVDGEIHLSGSVDRQQAYVGEGRGRFRWEIGGRTYAGALSASAEDKEVRLAVKLTSPLNARLDASFEQTEPWPWRFTFEAPRFDPGEELAPDSSLQSLAASLRGQGTIAAGEVSGRVVINDTPLILDPLQFTRGEQLSFETVLHIGEEPGRLAASGAIDLEPTIAWRVNVEARGFDPGVFAAAWPGELNFDLRSKGRTTQAGPAADLELENLNGRLRGRRLSGAADLSLTPDLVVSGALTLHSGESDLRFRGEPGDQIAATVSLDVASLDDWLPESSGELIANFAVHGLWPELSIKGSARGSDLRAADVRVDAFALQARIDDPLEPVGSVRLHIAELATAGFNFETVRLRASRKAKVDRLQLSATGRPLAFDLGLQGARMQDGWSGSMQRLVVDVQDAARLALRQPVHIAAMEGGIEVSQACLADEQIELCFEGGAQADGAMQASYSLANVPLALGGMFAPAPVQLAGTLEGRGKIRRTSQGKLFGEALLRSESGRVLQPVGEATSGAATAAQTLLAYRDLRIVAQLSGAKAHASLHAQLGQNGLLRGEATLRGVGQPDARLSGSVQAHIPDIAPLAILAPQLADVHGRLDAQLNLAGNLQSPQLSGRLNATEFIADLPAVGLHLHDGQMEARSLDRGEFATTGDIASGPGRVAIAGTASTAGAIDLNVNGDRFLAVDVPGAHVLITPDLQFVRENERMRLSGTVRIPQATVNAQKLSRGGERARQPSPDVVVVDAKSRQDEAAEAPLFVDVTVILGEDVELIGFGLQAQLDGRLDIHEAPGESTTASGVVRVAGTYEAYGQHLTIQRGQLLYASTPLGNPRLSIVATREIEEVTAGLRISGSAQNPQLTVLSDPPLGQANALSYLVAGKPLNDIGASAGEGDAVQAAARSLGTALGGLLAKSIGGGLGVDEVVVRESELIGGAALTVGEYLSPRLYLSYGIGLFEPGDVVTLRYRLTEDLSLKAQKGPEHSRAGIEYRIER